jgi:hypothetical protein
MPNRFEHCMVDVSTWPADERAHILDLAHKHNTTVEGTKDNFDTLMGTTEDEHRQTTIVFKVFHKAVAYGFKKASLGVVVALFTWLLLSIAKLLGFDTTVFAPMVEEAVKATIGGLANG